ncbi:unnamed protein product [Musa hybrid cultivar]
MESYVKNLKGELSCSTRTRRTVPPTPPPLPLPLSVHKTLLCIKGEWDEKKKNVAKL